MRIIRKILAIIVFVAVIYLTFIFLLQEFAGPWSLGPSSSGWINTALYTFVPFITAILLARPIWISDHKDLSIAAKVVISVVIGVLVILSGRFNTKHIKQEGIRSMYSYHYSYGYPFKTVEKQDNGFKSSVQVFWPGAIGNFLIYSGIIFGIIYLLTRKRINKDNEEFNTTDRETIGTD